MPRVLVFTIVFLLLAACTPAPPPAPAPTTGGAAPPAERPVPNQTLRFASTTLLPSLSPEAGEVFRWGFLALYDSLVNMDPTFKVVPWVAESWEQPTPTTWRMKIRRDLTFSNGDKLTGADVEFTARFMLETKTPPISNFTGLADVKLVDDYTVDFLTKSPDPSVLSGMAYLMIMPKAYFEKVGRQGFAAAPIGSGPYELIEYKSGDTYRFKQRATAHPFRKPVASEISYRAIPQISAIIAGLQAGEIDVSLQPVSADQSEQLKRSGMTIVTQSTENFHIFFPVSEAKDRNTPLNEKRVRLALNYAVDKNAMNQQIYAGAATVVGHLAPPGSPAWDDSIKPIPFNVAEAKRLLAEAGYPNGFKLPVGLDYSAALADLPFLAIQANLKEVGVEIALNKTEYGIFIDKFIGKSPKGDLFWSSLRDSNGFNALERTYYGCTNPNGSAIWWCNAEFDRLNAQAAGEPDLAKRQALLRGATKAIADDIPAIFLFATPSYLAMNAKVRGINGNDPIFRTFDQAFKVE